MSEPTPTSVLTVEQEQRFRDDLLSNISALAQTIDSCGSNSDTNNIRVHAFRALAKLAENPTFHSKIASTALVSVSQAIQYQVQRGGYMSVDQSRSVEAAAEIYNLLTKSASAPPAISTTLTDPNSTTLDAPTGPNPAPTTPPAARDIEDWELASSF
ncbi:hypothetical protein M408DRAFT_24095 [Serendipita vermifera MAFF 305830]|uniref:Uncharacterized protein n=1 Tax=Serendipita vermifera MAFF 305830 TaxID=933852 RepID=A0A0C3B7G8_SERVB|nr:hypothetical protein M408DRAFT_24095 [Serendipita vermifera MAFF 305830]